MTTRSSPCPRLSLRQRARSSVGVMAESSTMKMLVSLSIASGEVKPGRGDTAASPEGVRRPPIVEALNECMRQRDRYRKALEEIEKSTASHPLTDHALRIARPALDESARPPGGTPQGAQFGEEVVVPSVDRGLW